MKTHITSTGQSFIIRQPGAADAESIINYSKVVFASTDQVLNTLEEYAITVEQEKNWINGFNANPHAKLSVAVMGEAIVGMLFFSPGPKKKNAHTGEFGVNVHPDHQGKGIGKALVKNLLDWAKAGGVIEKIYLQVLVTNTHAISLYKNLGFIEEGRHVRAVKQSTGEYVDVLQMYVNAAQHRG